MLGIPVWHLPANVHSVGADEANLSVGRRKGAATAAPAAATSSTSSTHHGQDTRSWTVHHRTRPHHHCGGWGMVFAFVAGAVIKSGQVRTAQAGALGHPLVTIHGAADAHYDDRAQCEKVQLHCDPSRDRLRNSVDIVMESFSFDNSSPHRPVAGPVESLLTCLVTRFFRRPVHRFPVTMPSVTIPLLKNGFAISWQLVHRGTLVCSSLFGRNCVVSLANPTYSKLPAKFA